MYEYCMFTVHFCLCFLPVGGGSGGGGVPANQAAAIQLRVTHYSGNIFLIPLFWLYSPSILLGVGASFWQLCDNLSTLFVVFLFISCIFFLLSLSLSLSLSLPFSCYHTSCLPSLSSSPLPPLAQCLEAPQLPDLSGAHSRRWTLLSR